MPKECRMNDIFRDLLACTGREIGVQDDYIILVIA